MVNIIKMKFYPKMIPGKTDWKQFSHIIENNISLNISLKTAAKIDTTIFGLTSAIKNATLDSSPLLQNPTQISETPLTPF